MQNQVNMYNPKKKLLIILVVFFVIVILSSVIFYLINRQKTASLDILIAPSSATVRLNGKKYKTNQTYQLKPGSYTVTISASEFISQEFTISLSDNQSDKLYTILNPEVGNEDWYEQHPKDLNIANIISDYYSNLNLQEYREKYPIVNILPIQVVEVNQTTYDWTEYRIDYGNFTGCDSDFCLKITDSTGDNYNNAIEKMKSAGYNPEQYQIIYEYTPVESI